MKTKSRIWRMVAGLGLCVSLAMGGTFGRVVPIGGHTSDLALDEARGVLYIANFTANRIEIMSLADGSIQTSMNVAAQPGSLAISRDGRYLVVGHFANFGAPSTPGNGITVIDLETRGRQTFVFGFPVLGVAFGIDNRALVVTSSDFVLFDPVSGVTEALSTVAELVAKELPVPSPDFPPNIIAASVTGSADGRWIFGLTDTFRFSYAVERRVMRVLPYTSEPAQAPRTVSVAKDGSIFLAGWALEDRSGTLLAQFPGAGGTLNLGSHAIDSDRGLVYAQVAPQGQTPKPVVTCGQVGGQTICVEVPGAQEPAEDAEPPSLQVLDADNLTVRERFLLRENLAGKSVLSSDGSVLYSASDSGVTILPVGQLDRERRVHATVEDLIFRGNFCDRRVATQEIGIFSPGGVPADFTLSSKTAGITFTPSSGVTPATVRVSIDPNAFQNIKGTVTATIDVESSAAVNVPKSIRVLINNREPDQRGTIANVPGTLVDLVADPVRDRFYLLRQDTNEVLVYNGTTYNLEARLRTGNTPWSMAITFDRRFLLVGNDNSQIANIYDLETLETLPPIRMPGGHYPRSIAASGKAILVASRVAGPIHRISQIDLLTRSATALQRLGIYENDIHQDTALTASPNGSSILIAQANGKVMLYNANVDSFTVSRKDGETLAGAYAASSFDQYVVGGTLLNSSLVPVARLDAGSGKSSGFAFLDQTAYRVTAADLTSHGVIQKVELNKPEITSFTRTVAPLYSRNVIVSLTNSGFTVLPWNYDASVAPPSLNRVVNAADGSRALATGGLISIFGSSLSPVNMSSQQMPLPTALGESCLTVNGVPVPVLFVSGNQINAQVPFSVEGNVTLILRTPGGVSDNFNLTVLPSAPGVFRTTSGPFDDVPTVVRQSNSLLTTLSNPLHRGDRIVIYVTGLGRTNPAIEAGMPAPGNPLLTTLVQPVVSIGGVELPIEFAGLSPGQVGVYQINAIVPGLVPLGVEQPLVIQQGGSITTVAVRVVD